MNQAIKDIIDEKYDGDILKALENFLLSDKYKTVRLDFGMHNHYFNKEFVEKCINDIKLKLLTEDEFSSLEKLGTILLFDSAGIDHFNF